MKNHDGPTGRLIHIRAPDGRYIAALSIDNTKVMLFNYGAQKWST